jgi:hypothetical protein
MSRSLDWRNYVNEFGDFELPNYLYQINKELMKQSLDLGTLLSDDKAKLRAYKEQIKSVFKRRWMELAQALEFFDIIVPCRCSLDEFCEECAKNDKSVFSPSTTAADSCLTVIVEGNRFTSDCSSLLWTCR